MADSEADEEDLGAGGADVEAVGDVGVGGDVEGLRRRRFVSTNQFRSGGH